MRVDLKLLYKYFPDPKLFLEEGYIRATQLPALNDPFEALYCKDSLVELARECEYFMSPDELIGFIDNRKNEIGVICFSESKDNLLMWSHYANEHKGAVIGLMVGKDKCSSTFKKLTRPSVELQSSCESFDFFNGDCLPVSYRKQPRYRVDKFDADYSNISVEGVNRFLFEIFQQKCDEWIYEKEYRITLHLSQADKVIVDNIEQLKGSVNPSLLKEMINAGTLSDEGKFTINLDKISNPIDRQNYASLLTKLSNNPSSLYLFKISSYIKSIYYGYYFNDQEILNCQNLLESYKHLEQWKVSLN